jgi:LysR family transcriptional regulator, transcriptional activator for dmlA
MIEADLSFFSKVAQARTLTQAAGELDYSVAAVSKRLTNLEKKLGVKLLRRSPRALSLTDEGEKLLAGANLILTQVEQLRAEVSGPKQAPRGRLRINATFGFGRRFLAPLVNRYINTYPEVEVQLILTDTPLDLAAHAIDVCIWLDPLPEARLIARKIAACQRVLCASPSYLKQFGTPKTPADLNNHRCILLRQTDANFATWQFTKGRTSESVRVSGHMSSNDGEVVKHWVMAGQGLMVRSEWDVSREIEQKKLVRLLPEFITSTSDIIAWYPPGLQRTARLTRFLEVLTEEFKGPQSWRL